MTMWFPDDLRGLLRDFTRPVFQYYAEFNAYKQIHGDCHMLQKLRSDPERAVMCLRAYLDTVEDLRIANETYRNHMDRPRGDLTVPELLQYRVDQNRLHEETAYASWVTCWYHQQLQSEVLGTFITHFPPYNPYKLYEEDDDYSLRRWEWTVGGWVATEEGWSENNL